MANIARYSTASTPNPITEFKESVNTPDYEGQANVLINPDLANVAGWAVKYWKHVAGELQLMTQAERDAVDAAEAAAIIAAAKNAAKNLYDALDSMGRVIRATSKLTVDELNIIRQWITDFKAQTAAATNLSNFQSRVASLPNLPDRTYAQAKTSIGNIVDGE